MAVVAAADYIPAAVVAADYILPKGEVVAADYILLKAEAVDYNSAAVVAAVLSLLRFRYPD